MSKEIVPKPDDYVDQPYTLTQARYSLPMRFRKLLHVVMTHAQITKGERVTMTFRVGDLVKAFEKGDDSGKAYKRFRLDSFSTDLMHQIVRIERENGDWDKYPWVDHCHYDKRQDTLTVRISAALLPLVLDYRQRYTRITLAEMDRFEGRHAWRYYELFCTEKHRAGRDGNPSGQFFYDMTIDEIRDKLDISPSEYKRTGDLRTYAVEAPIAEINALNLGIRIVAEPQRRGKYLTGFRFLCTVYDPTKERPAEKPTRKELSDEELKDAHPERFAEILAEVKAQGDLFPVKAPTLRAKAQEAEAVARLRAELQPQKSGPGRPRKVKA